MVSKQNKTNKQKNPKQNKNSKKSAYYDLIMISEGSRHNDE